MAIRFPSLNYLLNEARQSFLRFPLTILSSLLAVIMAIYLIETQDQTFNRFPYINAMLCAALGISLYFCVAIFARRQQLSVPTKIGAQLLGTTILVGIYFSLPDADSTHNVSLPYIRFALYSVTIHLLASFIPFLFKRQLNGFWNYNKALFLRLLTSVLYSAALFTGLVMALLALKLLFEIEIPDELYPELFIAIAGVFNTWLFVAGIPLNFEQLDSTTTYPRGLKMFAQYILLPLLLLYLLILYGYGIKIILSWNWPEGIVSYLIMVVSVLGILNMLLIYPYALQTENQWIKKVSKAYYLLLLPLLVLLFLAIGMRLAAYGFTINRYLILITGIWLTIVCFYFLSGRNNIKFIPVSLAAVLLFISIGPWSIFSVSERSQVHRLEAALTQGGLMAAGKIKQEVQWVKDSLPQFYSPEENRHEGQLSDSLHNEIKSILDYLDYSHGFSAIQPWYEQPIDSMIAIADKDTSKENKIDYREAEVYMQTLGLPYRSLSPDYPNEIFFTYRSKSDQVLDIENYDRLLFLGQLYYRKGAGNERDFSPAHAYKRTVKIEGKAYRLAYSPNTSDWFSIVIETDTLKFPLGQLSRQLTSKYPHDKMFNIPATELQLEINRDNVSYRLVIDEIAFMETSDSLRLETITGKLLIGKKK